MKEEYKSYSIESNQFSNKLIKAIGKGSVHKQLRGLYTSAAAAKEAIDLFLEANVKTGVKQNATTKNSNRDN